jgi:hypothetical protein
MTERSTDTRQKLDLERTIIYAACKESHLVTKTSKELLLGQGIKADVGQKLSRVVNKWLQGYGIDKHPMYNTLFAKFADAINPVVLDRTAVLSVHPLAFLTMSHGVSWTTCQSVKDGGPEDNGAAYSSGTLSYMNDPVSMVFYTVSKPEEYGDNYTPAAKIHRQIFCYGGQTLLQSRLYPADETDDTGKSDMYRAAVQSIIAACEDIPNLWVVERGGARIQTCITTHEDARHFADYDHHEGVCTLSRIKSAADYTPMCVGSPAYCISCGVLLEDDGSLHCPCIVPCCTSCGSRVDEDEAVEINGRYYCRDCVSLCDHCSEYALNTIRVQRRNGSDTYYCDDCIESSDVQMCDICGEWCMSDAVNTFDGNGYCPECWEEKVTVCSVCSDDVLKEDAVCCPDDGFYYCDKCYDEKLQETGVHECAAAC